MGPDRVSTRRPLTRTERSLLDALLDAEFDGAAELRAQSAQATASPGCECGCGTIDLHVPPELPLSSAPNPSPVEGAVLDAGGETIGGILIFVRDGRLDRLEIYSWDEPLPFPVLERVRVESAAREVEPEVAGCGEKRRSLFRRLRGSAGRP